jgi:hypothetical protein
MGQTTQNVHHPPPPPPKPKKGTAPWKASSLVRYNFQGRSQLHQLWLMFLSLSLSKIKFIQEQSNEHCKKHIEPTSKEEITLAVLEEKNRA